MRSKWIAILLIVLSCRKETFQDVSIIGHGGNGLTIHNSIYQANTLESIELALGTEGVEGVEIDLQIDLDGELWMLHDDHLEIETNGKGCIPNYRTSELEGIRFKSIHKERLRKFRELNFETYTGKTLYLDVRHYNACQDQVVDVNRVLNALEFFVNTYSNIHFVFIINNKSWLNSFKSKNWEVICELDTFDEVEIVNSYFTNYDGIAIRNSSITSDQVNQLKQSGKKVYIFDLRSAKFIRKAMSKNPNGIIVDDIKIAVAIQK